MNEENTFTVIDANQVSHIASPLFEVEDSVEQKEYLLYTIEDENRMGIYLAEIIGDTENFTLKNVEDKSILRSILKEIEASISFDEPLKAQITLEDNQTVETDILGVFELNQKYYAFYELEDNKENALYASELEESEDGYRIKDLDIAPEVVKTFIDEFIK